MDTRFRRFHTWGERVFSALINTGVDSDLAATEARYIRLTNGIALLAILLSGLLLPYALLLMPETWPLLVSLLAFMLSNPWVVALNRWRRHLAAKLHLFLTALVSIVVASVALGGESNFHLNLLAILLVSQFVHPWRERRVQLIIAGVTGLSFIALELWFAGHAGWVTLSAPALLMARLSNTLGFMAILVGFLFYIAWNNRRVETELEDEKRKTEQLLHNILPPSIARRLGGPTQAIADGFAATTILFADIVGFTRLSASLPPESLVALLNRLFSRFDQLVERQGLEKIKTIGDAYMVAAGIPIPRDDHLAEAAELALAMREALGEFNREQGHALDIRIGIHTGPAVAGVIGLRKFAYDVWGDTVNTASRMESQGLAGQIQVSEAVRDGLEGRYRFIERGDIDIKGKGRMRTFILLGRNLAAAG